MLKQRKNIGLTLYFSALLHNISTTRCSPKHREHGRGGPPEQCGNDWEGTQQAEESPPTPRRHEQNYLSLTQR